MPPTQHPVRTFRFKMGAYDPNAFLSNASTIEHTDTAGVTHKSLEHQYQAEKALYFNQPNIAEYIRATNDPYLAKLIGKCKAGPNKDQGLRLNSFQRTAWEHHALDGGLSPSRKAMEKALHDKFNNHPRLAQLLLDTGDDHLMYSDDSAYWGDHNGKGGQNHMGEQLMYIRSQLRIRANA